MQFRIRSTIHTSLIPAHFGELIKLGNFEFAGLRLNRHANEISEKLYGVFRSYATEIWRVPSYRFTVSPTISKNRLSAAADRRANHQSIPKVTRKASPGTLTKGWIVQVDVQENRGIHHPGHQSFSRSRNKLTHSSVVINGSPWRCAKPIAATGSGFTTRRAAEPAALQMHSALTRSESRAKSSPLWRDVSRMAAESWFSSMKRSLSKLRNPRAGNSVTTGLFGPVP
jgi:hypothetical protein